MQVGTLFERMVGEGMISSFSIVNFIIRNWQEKCYEYLEKLFWRVLTRSLPDAHRKNQQLKFSSHWDDSGRITMERCNPQYSILLEGVPLY